MVVACALSACSGEEPALSRQGSRPSGAAIAGSSSSPSPVAGAPAAIGGGASGSGAAVSNPNGGLIPVSAGSAAPSGGGSTNPGVCASAEVAATRITPTVYLVVDGSGSMRSRFGQGERDTRWTVLREALVGTKGVITQLESVVKFGMSIYSNSDPAKCPGMTTVAPELRNLSALGGTYPQQEPGGGTPTGEALQKVVDSLPDFNLGPDSDVVPPIIILATDGEPNGCGNTGGIGQCNWADPAMCLSQLLNGLATAPPTYDTTLAAVRAARAKNIAVWVISLADGLNTIPDLQKTANIGAGLADNASPGAPIYSPKNPDELVQTLGKLIGGVVTCEVSLAGTLEVSRACEGVVKMNGTALRCNDEQGWKPLDSKRIQLQGSACDSFKSDPGVLLQASFPCDVVVLQ